MDQKIQGGNATPPPLLSGAPTGEREKEGGSGKKEDEEEKKRDREKEGVVVIPAGAGGAGTCGPGVASGDQSHFSIKESSLSEGNVKLKIGLQAKRMKKPPKILENYVCRPAFRATVRHTGRGGGSARGNRAGVTGDGQGTQSQSPLHGREKEREKSPSVTTPAPASTAVPSSKTPTPPPAAPPLASIATLSPSQVNGNAPPKRVRREIIVPLCILILHRIHPLLNVCLQSTCSPVCNIYFAHRFVFLYSALFTTVALRQWAIIRLP